MVDSVIAPPVAVIAPPATAWLAEDPAAEAGIARYLAAGERMSTLMGVSWKVGAVLFVLVALAWAMGVLPGAVKLLF